MPNMANITVKKNDGTTDVVYTAFTASAGDKTPAVWKNQTVGTAASHRPVYSAVSRDNGTGTGRRVDTTFSYPALVTGTDGVTRISDKLVLNVSGIVPKGMNDTDVNEAVSQGLNLSASTLIKDTFKIGYTPT